MPLDRLAKRAKEGVRAAGGFPIEFMTIAVSDGISMGHEGMRASLVSREVIADSVETVMHAERFDALVTFAGCDKSLPGMLMAAARLNLPVGVPLRRHDPARATGRPDGEALDIVSVFEAVGAHAAGTLTDEELAAHRAQRLPDRGQLRRHVHRQHHGVGRRGARHVRCPGSASAPAVDRRRDDFAYAQRRGRRRACSRPDIRPRQILTKEAFENAIAVVNGPGRLHQRRAPPARHRQRGPGRARARRLQPGRPRGCPTSPT